MKRPADGALSEESTSERSLERGLRGPRGRRETRGPRGPRGKTQSDCEALEKAIHLLNATPVETARERANWGPGGEQNDYAQRKRERSHSNDSQTECER